MSFSLSRVPKRVALTALHGLCVGTSCTLLLLLEDRRRRIEQARRAVHNGQKIRAAKHIRKKNQPSEEETPAELSTTLKETHVADYDEPSIRLQELPLPTTPLPSQPALVQSGILDKIRRIKEAAALGDPASLRVGALTLKRIAKTPEIVTEEYQPGLIRVALTLYRAYWESGLTKQAERTLEYINKIGRIPSTEFHDLSRNHIDQALTQLETSIQELRKEEADRTWVDARLIAQGKLEKVLSLLLPEFQEGSIPSDRKWEWTRKAETAIQLALDLGAIRGENDEKKLLPSLTKGESFVRVVRGFVGLRGRLSKADPAVWHTIGNVISDSVELGTSPDPASALLYLAQYCPPGLSIRSKWVAKLLWVDWQQFNNKKDIQKSLDLFSKFETLGGCEKVNHVDAVYRVMFEIALDVKEWQIADDFLARLKTVKPEVDKDPHVLGIIAKAKAKLGDWEGVWEDLQVVKSSKDHLANAFVPILKEYSKTHAVREVDEFLRVALQELGVPITPYMVTLVGNQYGTLRDVRSFVSWLQFCAGQGVQVDAAFGNTILRNCRRQWEFDYLALKRVYRALRIMNPSFVDEVTQNMIVSAALTATRRSASPKHTHQEVVSLAVKFRKEAKSSDPHDMRLWMRRAYSIQNYRLVQNMYEKAVKQGAPLDDGHLLLNIKAILHLHANLPKAVRILKEAKQQNILVERATAEVFTFYLRRMFFASDHTNRETVLQNVRNVLLQLQAAGLNVAWSSLLRVAYLCLSHLHHVEEALNFAQSALALKKSLHPDDVPTFQVFLLAYTFRNDVSGLMWTITGASKAGILHKERVMEALRVSRRLLLKQMQTFKTQEALAVVEKALGRVHFDRFQLSEEREELQQKTMRIMASAASGAVLAEDHDEMMQGMEDVLADLEATSQDVEEALPQITEDAGDHSQDTEGELKTQSAFL